MSIEISRRNLIKVAGGLGAASILNLSDFDFVHAASTLNPVRFANWSLYLDYDNKLKNYPTLVDFTKKTGIPVKYMEVIDDNDTFTAKVTPQLKLKKDIGYDLFVLTEWMAARWIDGKYVAKFDDAKIPNKKNILPYLLNRPLDPGRHYSLPWAGIIAGFAWNKKRTPKGIHSMEQLFDKSNKGKIEVLSELRDTIG
jgi:spermidine/putrescine transport system substrate-binding protein